MLLDGSYQIHIDENYNPYKELINFTLSYFKKGMIEKPLFTERLLRQYFPCLKDYIKLEIKKISDYYTPSFKPEKKEPFIEVKAMKELVGFVAYYFNAKYPIEDIRNQKIHSQFQSLAPEIIKAI